MTDKEWSALIIDQFGATEDLTTLHAVEEAIHRGRELGCQKNPPE